MNLTVIDAGVDWITATHRSEGRHSPLWYLANSQVNREHKEGNDLTAWKWNGYDGYTSGSAAVGLRPDGVICRISGAVAARYWRAVAQLASNVSRIDVQATVRNDSVTTDLARQAWNEFTAAQGMQGRPASAQLILNHPSGRTAVLGSRKSERYARIYDKGAESGDPRWAGCWRYEVELKAATALRVAKRLLLIRDTSNAAIAFVHAHLSDRGVAVPFQRTGSFVVDTVPARATDNERRLLWLRSQVAPAIARLVDDGLLDAVLAALGLAATPEWYHKLLSDRLAS